MAELPYMPWFPADWLLDVVDLSYEERGVYFDLLCMTWMAGKPLPDNDRFICRRLGITIRRWKRIKPSIVNGQHFRVKDGCLWQKRLEAERERINEIRAKRSAARKGSVSENSDDKSLKDKELDLSIDVYQGETAEIIDVSENFGSKSLENNDEGITNDFSDAVAYMAGDHTSLAKVSAKFPESLSEKRQNFSANPLKSNDPGITKGGTYHIHNQNIDNNHHSKDHAKRWVAVGQEILKIANLDTVIRTYDLSVVQVWLERFTEQQIIDAVKKVTKSKSYNSEDVGSLKYFQPAIERHGKKEEGKAQDKINAGTRRMTDDEWKQHYHAWVAKGLWPSTYLGPPPDDPNTRFPTHILDDNPDDEILKF